MIVEGDSVVRDLLSRYFMAAGYQVASYGDGLEALRALALQVPDLVIVDGKLPGMDGGTFVRHLRSQSLVPVILLSASRKESARIAKLDLEAVDYLVIPFDIEELRMRVRTMIQRLNTPTQSSGE